MNGNMKKVLVVTTVLASIMVWSIQATIPERIERPMTGELSQETLMEVRQMIADGDHELYLLINDFMSLTPGQKEAYVQLISAKPGGQRCRHGHCTPKEQVL